jgi:hypothetical protein
MCDNHEYFTSKDGLEVYVYVLGMYSYIIQILNLANNDLHTIHQMNVFQKALTISLFNIHVNIYE